MLYEVITGAILIVLREYFCQLRFRKTVPLEHKRNMLFSHPFQPWPVSAIGNDKSGIEYKHELSFKLKINKMQPPKISIVIDFN